MRNTIVQAVVFAIILVIALLAVRAWYWGDKAEAQSPEPSAVTSVAWETFQDGVMRFDLELAPLAASLQAATDRASTSDVYGEVLARTLDQLIWLDDVVIEACFAEAAEAYQDQLAWFALLIASRYHLTTASVGEPTDPDAIYEIFAPISAAFQAAFSAVEC